MSYVLAAVPDKPSSSPDNDETVSFKDRIKVDMLAVLNDGNSLITTYSLEIDNGLGGNFVALYGLTSNSLSLTHT